MPLLGCHMSIAGGYHNALLEAQAHGCETVQLFISPPRAWPASPLPAERKASSLRKPLETADAVRIFRRTLRQTRLRLPMAHACYLINLASPDAALYRRSVNAFVVELQWAEALGLRYFVMHPGSSVDGDEAAGLARVAEALDEIHKRCSDYRCKVLLETTAGQGHNLGHRFEHLARILALVKAPDRLGVCLDTCHVFAAGYGLAPAAEFRATMRAFNKVIGFKRLRAFHLNDSLKPQGSRVDRHAHIGRGCLGLEPFRLLLNERRFRNRPMVLETPKEGAEGEDLDALNLRVLRELVQPGMNRG
jgi:deoxyribonuclease-4